MATHFFGSAFFGGEFFSGTTPVVTTGGHFLPKKIKPRDFSPEREARARLREQIREALEGPARQTVEAAIKDYVHPQKFDTVYVPLDSRIDWQKIYDNMQLVETTVLMHLQMAEDDDDEDFLLLNG